MHINVLRCYYQAIIKAPTSYRRSMYGYWKEIYPDTMFSEQRIADQKNQIMPHANATTTTRRSRGHWITKIEIDMIKIECNILYVNTAINGENNQVDNEVNYIPLDLNEGVNNIENIINDENIEILNLLVDENIQQQVFENTINDHETA